MDLSEQNLVDCTRRYGKTNLRNVAFSAVGALEGQHRKKMWSMVDLSEQNLIDLPNDRC